MKKFRFLATAMVASMLAFAPSTALAADTDAIGVQINGEDLVFTDAEPVIVDNRVFVPFRTVFEKLEAEVSYDEATKTITAVKDGTTVGITVGDKNISLTKDGGSETVETDAASFIASNNYTYVPVRFAAQTLDCTVGWDAENQTAIIVEDDLFSLEGVTFEIANKYLAYANEFSTGNYELDGKLKFDMSMNSGTTGTAESFKLPGDITITGLTDASALNMDMAMKFDLADFKALMTEEEITESAEMLASLENIEMEMIFDMESGKFYIASPLFSTLAGAAENTWYLLDFQSLLGSAGMDFTELTKLNSETDLAKTIEAMTTDMPLENKYLAAAYIQSFNMMIDMFADSSFTQDGDVYTSVSEITEAGSTVRTTFVIETADGKVTGYKMNMNMGSIMTMDMAQKGLSSTIKMNMNIEDIMTMNMDGTLDYKASTKTPVKTPTGGTIVNLVDMMAGL